MMVIATLNPSYWTIVFVGAGHAREQNLVAGMTRSYRGTRGFSWMWCHP